MSKRDITDESPGAGSVDPKLHPPIAFGEEDWAWFVERCAALQIPDPAPQRARCEALYGHLVGVNRWLNLTTVTDPRGWLKVHLLDSLSLIGDPRLDHLADGAPCVDLGSGGGYPGLPLATWFPRVPWILVDARRKKAEFLAAACALTGNPKAGARHARGALIRGKETDLWRRCQLVTCRAMGQGDVVLREAADLVRPHGFVALYKGPGYVGEESDRTLVVAEELGYRRITERKVVLEENDPVRTIIIFNRER